MTSPAVWIKGEARLRLHDGTIVVAREISLGSDGSIQWRRADEPREDRTDGMSKGGWDFDLDPRPGFYYVSIIRDGGAYVFLRGPFTKHQDALDAVAPSREIAERVDPRACWYSFGTARRDTDAGPGVLDKAGL